MSLVSNDFGNICKHGISLKGVVEDYVLTFSQKVTDMQMVIDDVSTLITLLFEKYTNTIFKARLIARVRYYRINSNKEGNDYLYIHFPSYVADVVDANNIDKWVCRHLLKIISRLDSFHANGSNLLFDSFVDLHICISRLHNEKV